VGIENSGEVHKIVWRKIWDICAEPYFGLFVGRAFICLDGLTLKMLSGQMCRLFCSICFGRF
jgi:hypothetical protein